jgi:transcription antitermination factor NusG
MLNSQPSERSMSEVGEFCDLRSASAPAKNWFAVFTAPRHEKRVEEHLRVRGIESFLPLCKRARQWKDGSKGTVYLPLFSSYVFARIGRDGRVPVLTVPGVLAIVGSRRESFSVPDTYIHFLREGLLQGRIEPHPYLTIGARVRIRSGIMAGVEGILLRQKNDCRVVLTLEMIMKSVTVEVAIDEIEPVDRSCCTFPPQLAPLRDPS